MALAELVKESPLEPSAAMNAVPRVYNFAADMLERNLRAGRANKAAYIDPRGACTYGELADRVDRFGEVLRSLGIRCEERIVMALLDTVDWPTAFLGAVKAGVVPIPVNTLLTEDDYRFMLVDSRAKLLVVSEALLGKFAGLIGATPDLMHVVVSGENGRGHRTFEELLRAASPQGYTAPTTRDDICFWLYTSGSTGKPKGAVHIHSSLRLTSDLYAASVLRLDESDVCFSVAKLFFAYGLGNALTFPMAVGASTVLIPERPTAEIVADVLRRHSVTTFYAVPTFYALFLANPKKPGRSELRLRRCVSAGEALPMELGRRWKQQYGADILDGIGSTEMGHIYISNFPDDVKYGTTGKIVPGYEIRLIDDEGNEIHERGEMGEVHVRGPTCAIMYWNDREKSRQTFLGEWMRTGDKFLQDEEGYYVYCGRRDDMLKVSGMYVSPFEVEGALCTHAEVLEAAVVAWPDSDRLVKPKAFVVLKSPETACEELAQALRDHVKHALAPYKYPRWIEFRTELPKTATGKIQRFKLRAECTTP